MDEIIIKDNNMTKISTNYLGLKLRSPFIASSSGLTNNIVSIKELEAAGAGAIVLKSLFEEQIDNETEYLNNLSTAYTDNADFLHGSIKDYTTAEYAKLIQEVKQQVSIPVIGSINCYSSGDWISFAKNIEAAGADALELNIYSLPLDKSEDSNALENRYIKMIKDVTSSINIPVAVKISDTFTTLPRFVESCCIAGAKGVVLFNKFYLPDIDLNKMKVIGANPFTPVSDYHNSLRWTAILSSVVKGLDYSASTGVLTPEDGIKLILSGASTVQLCTVLYKEGLDVITKFNSQLEEFMNQKGLNSILEMKGRLNYSNIQHLNDAAKYERFQFVKTFGKR